MSGAPAKGLGARKAALRMLDGVLGRGLSLDSVAEQATQGLAKLEDRGLAAAIAGEVLRRLPDYDALIDSVTKRRLADDAKPRMVLRMALAQALALGTPPHAAISTALPLLAGGQRRLVHGVFGTLMRQDVRLPERPTLPAAVADRWRDQWGAATVEAAARAIAAPPPLDLTLRDPADTGQWATELGGRGLLPGHLRVDRQSVAALPGYGEGAWWVQDVSASLPARLLGPGEGRRALDLCAAPGGKTLQLAAAGWRVTALDIAQSRLARLSDNLARTGLAAELVAGDVIEWEPDEPFDAVLLDAPCSATGIFRRHPDVLHRVTEKMIGHSATLQRKMIERVADWVKPGGRIVYAVCSLERAEGEEVANVFLGARGEFALAPAECALPSGIAPTADGFLRILPGAIDDPGGADGFFIAAFERRADSS
ncbi:MAG: RsmB/NOP family class I SAM-dependent RNA methyltransferase [Parasphingopyxis sp.]|nr:RsmB/NOP family class I SAM-dependent RNA methyltransferase [Sphingomonadales bacterium]